MSSVANDKFNLIVHIGAGKAGSTSIQKTMEKSRAALNSVGLDYWGLMLEKSPAGSNLKEMKLFSDEFLNGENEQLVDRISKTLVENVEIARSRHLHTAVWSNEWFFRRPKNIIRVLKSLSHKDTRIRVVFYVRRHDSWLRSAYIQWGLKHKTYRGPILNFSDWLLSHKEFRYFEPDLAPWIQSFPDEVFIRNLDAVKDVVIDFANFLKIDPQILLTTRENESPGSEELFLRALFNNNFNEAVPPGKFDKTVGLKALKSVGTPNDFLELLLPSSAQLNGIVESSSSDRKSIDHLLLSQNQEPIETNFTEARSSNVSMEKMIYLLADLAIKNSIEIDSLKKQKYLNHKRSLNKDAGVTDVGRLISKDVSKIVENSSPVFAISTGRSGSTLVQRILNCHKDLVVWGEHYGFLNSFAGAFNQMKVFEQIKFPKIAAENIGPDLLLPTLRDPAAPLEWVNPWSREEFGVQVKAFVEGYFGGRLLAGQRWGFKEIRYNNAPALRMLKELFPLGRFLFIKRDLLEVTRSKVFAFIKEDKWSEFGISEKKERIKSMLKEASDHYKLYDEFTQRNGGIGVIIHFEEVTSDLRRVLIPVLGNLNLDPSRFDWDLADNVLNNVITKTKRDDEVSSLIKMVFDEGV